MPVTVVSPAHSPASRDECGDALLSAAFVRLPPGSVVVVEPARLPPPDGGPFFPAFESAAGLLKLAASWLQGGALDVVFVAVIIFFVGVVAGSMLHS